MNKTALQMVYGAFILVMLSLFFGTEGLFDKLKLLVLVLLSIFLLAVNGRNIKTIYHKCNVIFAVSMAIFILYTLLFKSLLFNQVRMMFFLGTLIGLAMSFHYEPKRKRMLPPPKPISIKKREVREVKKVPASKLTSTKKTARKTTKITKKTTKEKTKKVAKSSKDVKLISFSKDHEVAYILRKYYKRITKDNKEILRAEGKKFKSLKSYKPHNRESFYNYIKKYRVLSKLK